MRERERERERRREYIQNIHMCTHALVFFIRLLSPIIKIKADIIMVLIKKKFKN